MNMNKSLAPIKEKRLALEKNNDYIWDVLKNGGIRAKERASLVLERVRSAMKMDYYKK